jgi:hypothetical protein
MPPVPAVTPHEDRRVCICMAPKAGSDRQEPAPLNRNAGGYRGKTSSSPSKASSPPQSPALQQQISCKVPYPLLRRKTISVAGTNGKRSEKDSARAEALLETLNLSEPRCG